MFWVAVNVESKYLYNGCPYLGKDWTRSGDASLPTDVMMKLMIPLFSQGFIATLLHFLGPFIETRKMAVQFGGEIQANRRKIQDFLKKKRMLHNIMAVHSTKDTTAAITFYQCKKLKSLNILSILHKKLLFQSTIIRSASLKPCSQTKVVVDILDQISWL